MTARLTVAEPFPLERLGVNHDAFSEITQLSVPAPVLLIVSVCGLGLVPPCTPENKKFVALSPMVGLGAAVIARVTTID